MKKNERMILSAVYVYMTKNSGVSPSFKDVHTMTGIKSPKTISSCATRLRDAGYMFYEPKMARCMMVTEKGMDYLNKWENKE